MRRLPLRFRMRTLMILVALAGAICLVGREALTWWLRRGRPVPVRLSTLSATAARETGRVWGEGQTVPVAVTYNFAFGPSKPAPGTTWLLLAEVWFEDGATGLAVEGYTFDAPLVVGGREAASGSFIWDAVLPRPGRYQLRYFLHGIGPTGERQPVGGGGRDYEVAAPAPPSPSPRRAGPEP